MTDRYVVRTVADADYRDPGALAPDSSGYARWSAVGFGEFIKARKEAGVGTRLGRVNVTSTYKYSVYIHIYICIYVYVYYLYRERSNRTLPITPRCANHQTAYS